MKNPFVKQNNTTLIAITAVAAVAAGTVAYLYLTEKGSEMRSLIKHKLRDEAKNFAAGVISSKTGIKKRTVKKVADHIVK